MLKGAFIWGASGGTGVFLAREESGTWTNPAFYTIGSVSFGFQIGGQASEVILLAMTERGVTTLLQSSVKLGADVGIAAGPYGGRRPGRHGKHQRRHPGLFALQGTLRRGLAGWRRRGCP